MAETRISPFLMFQGDGEEAMNFYVSLFPGATIDEVQNTGGGTKARFTLAGQSVICLDSTTKHDFTFTPSFSFFVECGAEEEIDRLSSRLGEGGSFLMPLGSYGFSRKFAWLADRFGVSWQLNLV